MKRMIVHVVLCSVFLLGCDDEGRNVREHGVPAVENTKQSAPVMEMRSNEQTKLTDFQKNILSRLERIEDLWTNDIQKAYREIQAFRNGNPTSFFQDVEMCRRFVALVERLDIDFIPLVKRSNYVGGYFMALGHPLFEFVEKHSQNREFLFMIGADYIYKLQRDYPIVCALLEKEPSLPEGPSEPRLVMVPSKEEWEEHRRRSAEHTARRNRLLALKRYKFQLELFLGTYPGHWFDAEFRKEQINSFPEPRRTELINYIESKIGRRMKWRE